MEQATLMPDIDAGKPAPGTAAEFTLSSRDLLKELSGLQRMVPRKTTVPVLMNIHVQAQGSHLFLTAADTDAGLRTTCPARVKKDGRFTIPAHKLYEYARLLNDGDLTIRVKENYSVQITSGRSHTRMPGMPPDSFPKLPLFPAAAVKLDARVLGTLIARTVFAACVDESRYVFNGALLLLKPEGITMVATDGHRMAYAEHVKAQELKETRVLVPKKALTELLWLLDSSDAAHVLFAQDESTLYFAIGSRLLTSRQIAGRFPNYEAVLPSNFPHKTVLSRGELLSALQRVAQFADEKSRRVRIRLDKTEFSLASSTSELGEAEDILASSYSGPEQTIALNSQYLLDFLKTIGCDKVSLEFKDAQSAVELRPQNESNSTSLYRYVVMPMK